MESHYVQARLKRVASHVGRFLILGHRWYLRPARCLELRGMQLQSDVWSSGRLALRRFANFLARTRSLLEGTSQQVVLTRRLFPG